MEIDTAQTHLNTFQDNSLRKHSANDTDIKLNVSIPSQTDVTSKGDTQVTLSSQALSLLAVDKSQTDKTYEQSKIEYDVAKREYKEKVNSLPIDYRKMKMVKDRINEEIKTLKAEISKIKQSRTLNEEKAEHNIAILEQQIAAKSLAIIEVSNEFTQKLKEEERNKVISSESAIDILELFNAPPPEAPKENK